jgi:hypothetical protein
VPFALRPATQAAALDRRACRDAKSRAPVTAIRPIKFVKRVYLFDNISCFCATLQRNLL